MAPSTKVNRALLAELLRKQHAVIARRQTTMCGMTSDALWARIRPGGAWQRLLPGVYLADAWWPEAGGAAEVDSREWHLSPADWERTLRRHARLTAHGILVLHFTPKQIRAEPAAVAAAIRAALDAARAGGQPRVRALPATA